MKSREGIVDIEELQSLFKVTKATLKIKLKQAMREDKTLQGRIACVFPDTESIIDEAEACIGKIIGENLVHANMKCRSMVDTWSEAFAEHFCKSILRSYINNETGDIIISIDKIFNTLLQPYEKYLSQRDNSLVSIAGTINQSLLIRALKNSGLSDQGEAPQFKETGNKSKGDIHIYFYGSRGHITLSVEAKSYAARERLIRGLTDIPFPKVGVGFFTNALEFGKDRVTQMATIAQVSALYMPYATYKALTEGAKAVAHSETGRICRSLESDFIQDMKAFVKNGLIQYK